MLGRFKSGSKSFKRAGKVVEYEGTAIRQHKQPSTVLFIEYTKGGSLQKSIREVVDRLSGMLDFTMRVTERGGTPPGSILSS